MNNRKRDVVRLALTLEERAWLKAILRVARDEYSGAREWAESILRQLEGQGSGELRALLATARDRAWDPAPLPPNDGTCAEHPAWDARDRLLA